jgi:hypothetical protein
MTSKNDALPDWLFGSQVLLTPNETSKWLGLNSILSASWAKLNLILRALL